MIHEPPLCCIWWRRIKFFPHRLSRFLNWRRLTKPCHRRQEKYSNTHQKTITRLKNAVKETGASSVYVSKLSYKRKKPRRLRSCVDIWAPRSVIGLEEIRVTKESLGTSVRHKGSSPSQFCFADTTFGSLGKPIIPLATPSGIHPIDVALDVVAADIPPFLKVDVLHRESLTADTVADLLIQRVAFRLEDGSYTYSDE